MAFTEWVITSESETIIYQTHFTEKLVFSALQVEAVFSKNLTNLYDIGDRLDAVRAFDYLPEAQALASANKRVGNILKKVEGEVKAEVIANRLQEQAEILLFNALNIVKPEADKLFENPINRENINKKILVKRLYVLILLVITKKGICKL